MTLRGIRGKVWFEGADEDTMKLLFCRGIAACREEYEFWFGEFEVRYLGCKK